MAHSVRLSRQDQMASNMSKLSTLRTTPVMDNLPILMNSEPVRTQTCKHNPQAPTSRNLMAQDSR